VNKKDQDALDVDFTDDLPRGFYLKCRIEPIHIHTSARWNPIGKKGSYDVSEGRTWLDM
jgi:hypothetical protein